MDNNVYCICQITTLEKKEGTKTVWIETSKKTENYTQQQYKNNVEAKNFFKSLGGYERQEKSYTKKGYIVTQIVSIRPDRQAKTIYKFKFDN